MHRCKLYTPTRCLVIAAACATVASLPSRSHGMTIALTYDSTVSTLGNFSQIQNAMNYVALTYANLYSDSITVNINVASVAGTGTLGQSLTQLVGTNPGFTYSDMKSLLVSDAKSTADTTANASLGATDPTGGGEFLLSRAQGKALGQVTANDASTDGTFTFGNGHTFTFDPANRSSSGKIDFIGVAEHEVTEIMGRIGLLGTNLTGNPNYDPADLFRFTGAGVHSVNPGDAGVYFSVNNGTTNLKNYNSVAGGDLADWASGSNDAYNAFSSSGVMNPITPVGVTCVDVIGYDVQSIVWSGAADHTTWNIFTAANWKRSATTVQYTDAAQVVCGIL